MLNGTAALKWTTRGRLSYNINTLLATATYRPAASERPNSATTGVDWSRRLLITDWLLTADWLTEPVGSDSNNAAGAPLDAGRTQACSIYINDAIGRPRKGPDNIDVWTDIDCSGRSVAIVSFYSSDVRMSRDRGPPAVIRQSWKTAERRENQRRVNYGTPTPRLIRSGGP